MYNEVQKLLKIMCNLTQVTEEINEKPFKFSKETHP